MSKLRISDAPLLPDVNGAEKIPTGGRGDLAISMDQVKTFAQGGLPQQINAHVNNTENPHQVTKAQVGLGNVDNTSDIDKPISTETQEALDLKANQSTTYTKTEVNERLGFKADKTAVHSKSATLPTYYTKEAGVNSVTGVANSAYFNVHSTDEDTMLVEYQNIGGSAVATGKSYPSTQMILETEQSVGAIDVKLKRENVSVWDFFTESELATYKAAPTVFDAYRPIKEFFDYINDNDVRVAYCSGEFRVATGLVLGAGNVRTKLIVGNVTLQALNAIDTVLNINAGQSFVWLGRISAVGTGSASSNSYNSRTCRVGVQIGGSLGISSRNKYTAITANNFKEFGIFVNGVGSLSSLGYTRASNCGSGKSTAGYSLKADYSNPINSGSSGSVSQKTTLNVTALPPEDLASEASTVLPIHVIIDGVPYYVYSIDRINNQIGVFPWIDPSAATSGSLHYMFGGAVCVNGGDSSVVGIEMIDAVNCGAALVTGALYPPVVERIVSQFTGAALVLGQNPASAMIGGSVGALYCENNDFDLIRVTRADLSFNILNTIAFNMGKVSFSCAPRGTSGSYTSADHLKGVTIYENGVPVQYQRLSTPNIAGFNVTDPNNSDYIFNGGSTPSTITIGIPNDNYANLFGIYKKRVVVYGSGVGNSPTAVTFNLSDPVNYTIDSAGVVTKYFDSFDGFAVFEIIYRSTAKRFFISQVSNKDTSATVTYNPPSLAAAGTAGDSVTTTVTLTGATVGSVVQAAFSQYSADIEISAAVSAANTVTVKFKNTGAAAVDLASGTLTVKSI